MLRIVAIISQFPNREAFLENYEYQKNKLITVTRQQLPLLASLLIGCWLNIGFRDPSIFGVLPPLPDDSEFYLAYFQSCQILFENLFAGVHIPNGGTSVFNIARLNKFITFN